MFKDYIKKFYKPILIIFLTFIFFIISFLYFKIDNLLNKETIYNNIYINNINVSNLTKEEAFSYLSDKLTLNKSINLHYNNEVYTFTLEDFNVQYDFETAINKAYSIGRTENKIINLKVIKALENEPMFIQAEKSFDEKLVEEKLRQLEQLLYVEPKNATVVKTDDKFNIIEGTNGVKINFEQVYSQVLNLLENSLEGDILINSEVVEADYNSQMFQNFGDLLGSFETYFTRTNSNKGRISNIEFAASKINGTVLYPDEVFSTYSKFGDTTAENGYKLAPTIVNGVLIDDYGGGICQVSSTLYNAVLLAELDIVERKNHSLKVSYLDYGFDATIAGDYIDFKFKNSYDYPIYIESYVTENSIICNVYGIETRNSQRSIKFENELVQVIEPEEPNITYTNSLPKGVVKTKVTELKGYKYKLYKLVYENNVLIEKILINDSYYKPRSAEILIGTKE